ncbi:uncharacterized protein [Acropora muricata]|uniref:uncharacterized protein n=1 Tax=Acropora muricata TaxID=159855 RepID=UPI0034E5BA43
MMPLDSVFRNPFVSGYNNYFYLEFYRGLIMSASANQVTQAAVLLRRACDVLSSADNGTANADGPSTSGTSSSSAATGHSQVTAVQEHRRLFNRQMRIQPYSARRAARVTQRGRLTNNPQRARERSITRTFVCLSDKEQDRVPSITEKLRLKSNGLGEKTILLPILADADGVKAVLYDTGANDVIQAGADRSITSERDTSTTFNIARGNPSDDDETMPAAGQ